MQITQHQNFLFKIIQMKVSELKENFQQFDRLLSVTRLFIAIKNVNNLIRVS